jgi:hypothetical protein
MNEKKEKEKIMRKYPIHKTKTIWSRGPRWTLIIKKPKQIDQMKQTKKEKWKMINLRTGWQVDDIIGRYSPSGQDIAEKNIQLTNKLSFLLSDKVNLQLRVRFLSVTKTYDNFEADQRVRTCHQHSLEMDSNSMTLHVVHSHNHHKLVEWNWYYMLQLNQWTKIKQKVQYQRERDVVKCKILNMIEKLRGSDGSQQTRSTARSTRWTKNIDEDKISEQKAVEFA